MALKLPMVDLQSMYPNVLWGRSTVAGVMNITVLNCQRNVAACDVGDFEGRWKNGGKLQAAAVANIPSAF